MITPRENLYRFYTGQKCEWIPSSLDRQLFAPTFYPDNKARGLVRQQNPVPMSEMGGKDIFGVEWVFEASANGSMEVAPLFDDMDDILEWESNVVFPDLDSWDWEGCKKENAEFLNTDKMLGMTIYTGFFERLISFYGFEDAAVLMIDEDYEDAVKGLFDKLSDLYIDLACRFHKHFGVEIVEVHDDWGTQNSLMFSKATHDELVYPYIKKIIDAVHADGMFYEQHSCGKMDELLPSIISSGADTWRGQESANDKLALISQYPEFKFGVSVGKPKGADEAKVKEVLENTIAKFEGKNVWISLHLFTPEELKMAEEMFRTRTLV